MCIVCVDLIKQNMTISEAERNLGELVNDRKETLTKLNHYDRLKEALEQLDLEEAGKILDEGEDGR